MGKRGASAFVFMLLIATLLAACAGGGDSQPFVTMLDSDPVTFDPLDSTDAASEFAVFRVALHQLLLQALRVGDFHCGMVSFQTRKVNLNG